MNTIFSLQLQEDFEKLIYDVNHSTTEEAKTSQGIASEKAILNKFIERLAANGLTRNEMSESAEVMLRNLRYLR